MNRHALVALLLCCSACGAPSGDPDDAGSDANALDVHSPWIASTTGRSNKAPSDRRSSTEDEWTFRYDEAKREIIATRGDAILRYDLRALEGGDLIGNALQGMDGVTWSVPAPEDRSILPDTAFVPMQAMSRSTALCQAAVAVAVSLGCAAITLDCSIGTFISVGGVLIPCALLVALACATGAGSAAVVAYYCPGL